MRCPSLLMLVLSRLAKTLKNVYWRLKKMSATEYEIIINLLTQQNDILNAIYVAILFVIGVAAAGIVLFLLYKFICLFF